MTLHELADVLDPCTLERMKLCEERSDRAADGSAPLGTGYDEAYAFRDVYLAFPVANPLRLTSPDLCVILYKEKR